MKTTLIEAAHDFEPRTIETLELLELTYRGELWPDKSPTRRQLVDELLETGLIRHVPGINRPDLGKWSGERYQLTGAGTEKARELQRLYRNISVNAPHFKLLPNLRCTLGAASTTLVGGEREPINVSGIMLSAPRAILFAKRLPSVILSSTPEGLYVVTNSMNTIWDVHCKTVGDELQLSAEFHRGSYSYPWGHRSLGYTLRIVLPPTTNDFSSKGNSDD